jgi:hypothetical protein
MDSLDKSNRNRSNRNEDSADSEVDRMLSNKNGVNAKDLAKIRDKYANNPNLVDKIEQQFQEKHRMISKKARKFAELIRKKYSNRQYPFHVLLDKARLFKVKHGLSDSEFAEFQRIYELELVGMKSPDVLPISTNMMKVLGSINTDFYGSNMKVSDNDYKYLQEILKLHASSKPLHAQILLQSIQYRDSSFEALTGKYHPELGQRPGDSVHPVIAAMFIPKIDVLESHFLHSNLANIVKTRYNGEALTTRPDYELFYALTNDPNDVVCDSRSPVLDLLNRAQLQNQLWNSVLHLRNGQYYDTSFREFIGNVDMCKLNKQDNPDLVYGRFDGVVIKRLLSAFSFRPTVVTTRPIYQVVTSINPYQQNVVPVVSCVPMINLRLPPNMVNSDVVVLKDALEQSQFFLEHGVMVPRQTNIIYSRGVLFFYVDRRTSVLKFNDIQPFNVARMPVSISGFERLNDTQVVYEDDLPIGNDMYRLRSVVLAEVNNNSVEKNIVVGSSAIFKLYDSSKPFSRAEHFKYDPLNVNIPVKSNNGATQYVNQSPVEGIPETYNNTSSKGSSFKEMAQERGILFMYELVTDESKGEIQY